MKTVMTNLTLYFVRSGVNYKNTGEEISTPVTV